MRLSDRFDHATGVYLVDGRGGIATDPLPPYLVIPVVFRLARGRAVRSTFWTQGPKQRRELKDYNPLGLEIESSGEEGEYIFNTLMQECNTH